MPFAPADRAVIRRLAAETAAVAALPCQAATAAEWTRHNDLLPGRPLVWINEVPWHEMNVDDELTLECSDGFCRGIEWQLRVQLYQWRHFPADMVVEPLFHTPIVVRDTGFGIQQMGTTIAQGQPGAIHSQEFEPQIHDERDVAKIRDPELELDEAATRLHHEQAEELLGDWLLVRPRGVVHVWFAPWDELIRWYGVQPAMLDLALRPELIHACMDRLVNAYLARLRQWRELGLLDLTSGNYRVGSGGLAYTSELPQPERPTGPVATTDQWGCATAQIFSEVSPAMHQGFALDYERRWLSQFGLNYYGCCEPLHGKLEILASVPNLRKISMSPKADMAAAAATVQRRYVLSHKPNPAIFAERWDPAHARAELERELGKARGCQIEVIMKDVSTLRGQPQRLWEWAEIAMDVATAG